MEGHSGDGENSDGEDDEEAGIPKGDALNQPIRKLLTFLFALVIVVIVTWLVTYWLDVPAAWPIIVAVVLALIAGSITVAKDELRAASISYLYPVTLGLIVILLITNLVTGFVVADVVGTPGDNSRTGERVNTGADPERTECVKDAKIAGSNDSNPKFLLEILFSPTCGAGWGRLTRTDHAGLGNQINVSIYRRSDPEGTTRQDAVEPDVDSAYTTLIVRENPTDRLCVTGSISVAGSTEAAPPICV